MTIKPDPIRHFEEAFDAKRYREALSIIEDVVRIAPWMSTNWHNLGATYEALGQEDNAVAAYWQASKLHPARRGLASAWSIMSRSSDRLQRFITAVLSDNPDARPILVALAEDSALLNDPEIAEVLGLAG